MPLSRVLFCCLVLTLSAFVAGVFLSRKINYDRLSQISAEWLDDLSSHKQKPNEDGNFDTVAATDFDHLITLANQDDIVRRRADLIRFIWRNQPDPFTKMPGSAEPDNVLALAGLHSLASTERFRIVMDLGITSEVYSFRPTHPKSCLMLYQEGHRASFRSRKKLIERLLDAGCEVLALSLPLTGPDNSRPLIAHPRFGQLLLNDPDKLELLETPEFSTIQYFLTPPIAALNYVLSRRSFAHVGMTGFSGGGWVTTLVAALDPRIQTSYAVAGSVPVAVHAAAMSWGSYEQRLGALYQIANYPELYLMAAAGPGRRHRQFYNEDDPCCFSGSNWTFWRQPLSRRASALGGYFESEGYLLKDRHGIGPAVANRIVSDFAAQVNAAPGSP